MKPLLKGLGASVGEATGIVRVIKKLEEIQDFQEAEILVAETTNPAFVVGIAKASGVITDIGALNSHAAIISREFGIPCIVATDNATKVLKTGMRIRMDALEGAVYGQEE